MGSLDYSGLFALLGWVTLISYFFAKVEIHIEGKHGWASQLPTWRIEKHWLLDVFWGGRPLTGYHAWVFPFILLICHLGFFLVGGWTWELELRTMGVVALMALVANVGVAWAWWPSSGPSRISCGSC